LTIACDDGEEEKNNLRSLLGENVGCWYERAKRRKTRDELEKEEVNESSIKEIVYFWIRQKVVPKKTSDKITSSPKHKLHTLLIREH
jgi:hypothetical protein